MLTISETINLLGMPAKDKVTGFSGIITSVSFDLYGCICAAITPPVDNEGKSPDGRWYDVARMEFAPKAVRVMPVPHFATMDTRPADYSHGAAEKPVR